MVFASRTDESWWMWSVVAQPRAGSHVASAVVLVGVATLKPCPPALWDQVSMHHPVLVDLVGDSVAASVVEVSEVEASVVVVIVSAAVEESVTKVAAVASEDRHHQMLHLAPVAGAEVVLEVVSVVEAGLTVV